MKKRILIQIWQTLALLILSLFCFQIGDEAITRREYALIILIVLTGTLSGVFLLRKVKGSVLPAVLLISALVSFVFCFLIEEKRPVTVFPPEEIRFDIEASPDDLFDLTWIYWSRPNGEVNHQIEEWHPVLDIRKDLLTYEGAWTKEPEAMRCSGECSLILKKGFSLSRPAVSFISSGYPVIHLRDEVITAQPWSQMRIFGTGAGFSRQLVFAILFFSVCGVLNIPLLLCACLLQKGQWQTDPSVFHSSAFIYVSAFLIPVILVLTICRILSFYPFGEKTFLLTDMQSQYVDYLIYFRNILNGEKSLFYSFSKSIGDDFLSLYAYYLGNPLNWITALFPIEKIPAAIGIIIILRYGFCGLTAAIYFKKTFETKAETLIFSTAYALISLQFVIAEHIQLRDGAILLPVILLGIEELIHKNRSRLYMISLCIALLISYYSTYQICFFCVLYILFRMLTTAEFSWKRLGTFLLSSLFAAALCAVFLIPVAVQLTKGQKSFDPAQFTFTLNMTFPELTGKLFNSAFDMDQIMNSGFPNIFCGLFSLAGLPLFFMNTKISMKEKLLTAGMFLIMTAAMMIRAIDLILHGFNEPCWWPYRYSFIVCFFMISVSLRCFRERGGITSLSMGTTAVILFGLLVWAAKQHFSWFSSDAFYLNILLLCFALLVWGYSAADGKSAFALVMALSCLDLFLNGWMILSEATAQERSESPAAFQSFFEKNQPVIQALKTEDSGLYRTEKNFFRDANDAMALGYRGIGHYSSTLNNSLVKFLPKLGYRYYPMRILYGEGSDLAADSLLGIRYLLSDDGSIRKPYQQVLTVNKTKIYKNPNSLPFAFFAESNQAENPASVTFELQNEIFRSLTGETEAIYTKADIQPAVLENMQESPERINCYEPVNKSEDAVISWNLTGMAGREIYLYIRNDSEEIFPLNIFVNNEFLGEYFDGQGIPILPVSDPESEKMLTVALKPQKELICFDEFQVYFENEKVLEKYAEKIQKSSLKIQKETESSISGEIEAYDDGYLLFTIPYDKSWRVTVDGKKTSAEQAFDVFLSAPLSKGIHSFVIKYIPEGLEVGCAISAVTILLLISFEIIRKKSPNQKKVE